MDKAKANEFIFLDTIDTICTDKIYVSKDLNKLMDMNNGNLISIYAVVDTASGEQLFDMDFDYLGEPIITRVFIHKEFFINAYSTLEIVNV
jgi:hypothetical protein